MVGVRVALAVEMEVPEGSEEAVKGVGKVVETEEEEMEGVEELWGWGGQTQGSR